MTFVVDGTSNKLRLDMFASVVDPVSTPKLTAGTYDLGTITEPTSKTYFVASNGSDTEGTLYWKEGTAVLVTGGSINVQSAAGGYTIKVNLTAGDETIEAKYSGSISFDDQRQDAPRTPITANAYLAQYTGECMLANEQLGQITLLMQDAENTNQQIQLVMTVPYPTEGDYPADNVPIPTGTFEVVEGNPTAAGQIIPTSNDVAEGTYSAEIVYNSGVISYGVLIQGGTVTIAKEGETYNVTTALEGTKFSYSNNKLQLGQHVTDIVWNLTGAQFGDYAVDMTNPMSSLTGKQGTHRPYRRLRRPVGRTGYEQLYLANHSPQRGPGYRCEQPVLQSGRYAVCKRRGRCHDDAAHHLLCLRVPGRHIQCGEYLRLCLPGR